METDRHIGFEGQIKCAFDELGDLGVGLVKTERPQHDGQPGLPIADGPDPLFDVQDVVAKCRLARHEGYPHPVAQRLGVFRIGTVVGEDLEGQIPGLVRSTLVCRLWLRFSLWNSELTLEWLANQFLPIGPLLFG